MTNAGVLLEEVLEEIDRVVEVLGGRRNELGGQGFGNVVSIESAVDEAHGDVELVDVELSSVAGIGEMPDLHELVGLETALTKDLASDFAVDEAGALRVPGAEDGVVALPLFLAECPGDARLFGALLLLAEVWIWDWKLDGCMLAWLKFMLPATGAPEKGWEAGRNWLLMSCMRGSRIGMPVI